MNMPTLETARLIIRPLTMDDLEAVHRLLDVELGEADFAYESAKLLDEREAWLRWTVMNYEQLAKLYQPPYGDRAVDLKQSGELAGICGYVPCLAPFAALEGQSSQAIDYTCELGLYYAFSPAVQRRGYATEAAQAMVDYAFQQLNLKRIVAMTTHDNAASIGVMKKLGMKLWSNPQTDPPWFQIVGVLDKQKLATEAQRHRE
jgi:ribosomal-protein-alanine N-acetyltransferase